eukprot:185673-Pyramimonas_sp.AAC.1
MEEREECSGGFQSTPLMKAARYGQAEGVARALECTATNLDAIGADGRTALITGAANGHLEVVKVLMDAGCDLDIQDLSSRTAVAVAETEGHPHIAKAIKDEQERRAVFWSAIKGESSKMPFKLPDSLSTASGVVLFSRHHDGATLPTISGQSTALSTPSSSRGESMLQQARIDSVILIGPGRDAVAAQGFHRIFQRAPVATRCTIRLIDTHDTTCAQVVGLNTTY